MAVRIRLSRFGRLHRPFYRIIAIDSRRHREGEASEVLGSYDPLLKDKNIVVDMGETVAVKAFTYLPRQDAGTRPLAESGAPVGLGFGSFNAAPVSPSSR